MASRNRDAGHNLERDIVNQLREMGFIHAVTCRSESRSRDNQKVDIMNKDEAKNGKLLYNFQCKNYSTLIKYDNILKEMPEGENNIIIHRRTNKVNTRFIKDDDYAILRWETLKTLIQQLRDNEHQSNRRALVQETGE